MGDDFEAYQAVVREEIETCVEALGCQPILFVGSGLSRRYADTPTWEGLLRSLRDRCPDIAQSFAFYKQSRDGNLCKIGSDFAEIYRQWAWGRGRNNFPDTLFQEGQPRDIYIKHEICRILTELVDNLSPTEDMQKEIDALRAIQPHAVITTNYDSLLEKFFPEHHPLVRQKILRYDMEYLGEILKIHGCTSDPASLVFTEEDYHDYNAKHKYLSAKLLTYFAEHPLFFIGYSANDDNVKKILSDIDEIISGSAEEVTKNIFMIIWKPEISSADLRSTEQPIDVGGRTVTLRKIVATDLKWVFEAIGAKRPLHNVSPRVLRAFYARVGKLVRKDIPNSTHELDFSLLSRASVEDEHLYKILGIGDIGKASSVNLNYPYNLTDAARKLGFSSWNKASDLIKTIKEETGFDIRSEDNTYHVAVPTGKKGVNRRYSEEFVALLKKVQAGESYDLIRG